MIFLLVPTIALLYSMASHHLTVVRMRLRGPEAPPIDKLSATILALSYGVSNMKKRRIRLTLTLTSIITIAFSVTLLTSISSYTQTTITPESAGREIPYQGFELRTPNWLARSAAPAGLSYMTIHYLQAGFRDAIVSPRLQVNLPQYEVLAYTGISFTADPYITFIWHNGVPQNITASPIRSVSGISVAEYELNTWNISDGAWLDRDDSFECLISRDIAVGNNITLGDRIRWFGGVDLIVRGTFEPSRLGRDLDGEEVTPRDLVKIIYSTIGLGAMSPTGGSLLKKVPHSDAGIVVVPWMTLRRLGAEIMSVAVKPSQVSTEEAISLAYETGVHIFASTTVQGEPAVLLYAKSLVITTQGFDFIIVPLVISAFILTNTMLGGIYERRKDIFTLSVVGLSPAQVFLTFLAEAFVYGTIGAFLGYVLALVVTTVTLRLELSGILINFSSSYVVLSLGIAIAAVVIAALLPFTTVSRIATPSLERKWKLPVPKGDMWDIRFPILVSDEEMNGFLTFTREFLETRSGDALNLYHLKRSEIGTVTVVGGLQEPALLTSLDLLPPELGVSQEMAVAGTWDQQRTRYSIHVAINHVSGTPTDWVRRGTPVVEALRRHFLLWKSMKPEEKARYMGASTAPSPA